MVYVHLYTYEISPQNLYTKIQLDMFLHGITTIIPWNH